MQLLHMVLQKQSIFMQLLRDSESSLLIVSLDRLLMGTNMRSGKPDHLLNIAKFITFCHWLPKLAHFALKIFCLVAHFPSIHPTLLATITEDANNKLSIFQGFVECLAGELPYEIQSVPNLSHFLLGFSIDRPLTQQTLQEPGFCATPRSCLHCLLQILDTTNVSAVTEMGFRIIYDLCHGTYTALPTLRYLRSSKDFFYLHLKQLPPVKSTLNVTLLNQCSWLMKCIAIDLKGIPHDQHSLYLQKISALLVDFNNSSSSLVPLDSRSGHRLIEILKVLDFECEKLPSIQWQYFEPKEINASIQQCEQLTDGPIKLININKLQTVLQANLIKLQSAIQRNLLIQEIKDILNYAMQLNKMVVEVAAKLNFLEGWRQITEIYLICCSLEALNNNFRQQLILDLTQELLSKLLSDKVIPELVKISAGVLLILVTNLRCCNIEDGTCPTEKICLRYSASLQLILQGLVNCILKTRRGQQRVCIYFYGALLHFLRIQQNSSDQNRFIHEIKEVITTYSDTFIDVVCHDACSGHDVAKMEALSFLDLILSIEGNGVWLQFMHSRGYIQHFIDNLSSSNDALISELTSQSYPVRMIELYDCQMALFCRLASYSEGACILLKNGLLASMSKMTVFQARPTIISAYPEFIEQSLIPNMRQKFRQIFLPALRLCQSLLISLGMNNVSATHQILYFLLPHSETVLAILKHNQPIKNLFQLQELQLLTGILAIVACDDAVDTSDPYGLKLQSQIAYLQRYMLSLLPVYLLQETVWRQWTHCDAYENQLSFLHILNNVLSHLSSIVSHSRLDSKLSRILFTPSFLEAMSKDILGIEDSKTVNLISCRAPGIGLLVCHIQHISQIWFIVQHDYKLQKHRLQNVDSMTLDQLQSCLTENKTGNSASKHKEVYRLFQKRMNILERQRNILLTCLESALFLLWHHLDFYLVQSSSDYVHVPFQATVNQPNEFGDSYNMKTCQVAQDDLEKLRQDVITCLGDAFFSRLTDIQKEFAQTGTLDFLDPIIRRIQRLLLSHIWKK